MQWAISSSDEPDNVVATPRSAAHAIWQPWRNGLDTLLATERDRWFLWTAPAFGVGIAIYFKLRDEPHWLSIALTVLLLLIVRIAARHKPVSATISGLCLIVAMGAFAAKIRTEAVRAPVLDAPLRAALVTGHLERIEVRQDQSKRLTIRVQRIAELPVPETPGRVRIRVRKSAVPIKTGDAIRVKARLAPPPRPALPRGYDFARAAYFQGLGAVGYAVADLEVIQLEGPHDWSADIATRLQILRRAIGNRIEAAIPGEVGIMANALMTGERSGITKATNDLYRDAGIFHILSISGLHMAIMGGSVFVALRFILAAFPMIAVRYPIKKWAAAVAAVATFGYLLISGGAHPTVRSFLMIVIMFLAIMLDRPAIALRNVALAGLLILVVLPESLFNAGFQLSFAAVVALVAAYEWYQARANRRRRLGYTRYRPTGWFRHVQAFWLFLFGTIATTLIAGLATAPFAAFHFHTSQQYSVLTNMLAIPVSNLVVMPAALAAFIAMPFGVEAIPLWIMGLGIEIMTWSAQKVTALPGAVRAIPAFSEAALQLMIAGGLWLAIWREPWRILGLVPLIAGVYLAANPVRPDILMGKEGALVALRAADGRLAALPVRSATYELGRWIENDGDTREPNAVWKNAGNRAPFKCDLEGCTVAIAGRRLALPRSPAALIDDCQRADLLVITFPKPNGCRTGAEIFDFHRLKRYGTHAIFIEPAQTETIGKPTKLRIETVEQFRGHRPWTTLARIKQRGITRRLSNEQPAQSKTPKQSTNKRRRLEPERPEIDEGHPLHWSR